MAYELAHNGTRPGGMTRPGTRNARDHRRAVEYDIASAYLKLASTRIARQAARRAVAAELADHGEPAADQSGAEVPTVAGWDDGIDWAYEDWKLEREMVAAEREWESAMTRMDDDGAPIWRDHWAWFAE